MAASACACVERYALAARRCLCPTHMDMASLAVQSMCRGGCRGRGTGPGAGDEGTYCSPVPRAAGQPNGPRRTHRPFSRHTRPTDRAWLARRLNPIAPPTAFPSFGTSSTQALGLIHSRAGIPRRPLLFRGSYQASHLASLAPPPPSSPSSNNPRCPPPPPHPSAGRFLQPAAGLGRAPSLRWPDCASLCFPFSLAGADAHNCLPACLSPVLVGGCPPCEL